MPTKVSESDVRRVAKLARLSLTDAEAADLSNQISTILAYFEHLQTADTQGVAPLSHPPTHLNELRDDEPRPCLTQEMAQQNAPQSRDGYFRVPAVLDGSSGA